MFEDLGSGTRVQRFELREAWGMRNWALGGLGYEDLDFGRPGVRGLELWGASGTRIWARHPAQLHLSTLLEDFTPHAWGDKRFFPGVLAW